MVILPLPLLQLPIGMVMIMVMVMIMTVQGVSSSPAAVQVVSMDSFQDPK